MHTIDRRSLIGGALAGAAAACAAVITRSAPVGATATVAVAPGTAPAIWGEWIGGEPLEFAEEMNWVPLSLAENAYAEETGQWVPIGGLWGWLDYETGRISHVAMAGGETNRIEDIAVLTPNGDTRS